MTADAVGGVWRYTLDLAAGFAAQRVRPAIAVIGPAPSVAQLEEARCAGLELIETGLALDWTAESPLELAGASAHLQGLARRIGAVSVHLHAPALAGSGQWPAPAVVVAHSCVATWWRDVRGGELPEDFRWRTEAARAGLRAADAVIAPTAAHAASVRAVYGALDISVVHNGSDFVPAPSPSGEGQGEGGVLTAGRLWDEGKNVAVLDRMAPMLAVPVRAAGPTRGPNGAAIELPNLQLLGTLDPPGMASAYASASVFASLARYEPFGLAVLEAARAGLLLVLSDIPSFRELWDGAAIFVRSDADLLPALRQALDAEDDGGAQARSRQYTVAATVDGTLAVHRAVGALV